MANIQEDLTRTMFDCLARLYKQSQMLLLDADRLMGERDWQPMDTTGPAGLSNSLNSPSRWYARWATRFYMPTVAEGQDVSIDKLLFISIHFASDTDNKVNEPLVSAGRLIYSKPMNRKALDSGYSYWMCKYWFWGKPHLKLDGWRQTSGPSRYNANLKATETFAEPLYNITSSEKLEQLVINRLVADRPQA